MLERSEQGLGLQISQLPRNLLFNTSTDIVMALTVIAMYVIMCAALSLTNNLINKNKYTLFQVIPNERPTFLFSPLCSEYHFSVVLRSKTWPPISL